MPLALSDAQLKTVMTLTAAITPEKRSAFLERVAAMLTLRGRFNDADVADVAARALVGLASRPAA
jgi:hypothetical protein